MQEESDVLIDTKREKIIPEIIKPYQTIRDRTKMYGRIFLYSVVQIRMCCTVLIKHFHTK
jgi:hypothetical protein